MKHPVSRALGALAIACAAAQAHATVITFDEIAASNSNSPLTNEYAFEGVTFGSDNSGIWGGIGEGDPGNWGVAGTNGTQFLGNNGVVNGNTYVTTISFATGESLISFDTSRTNGSSAGQTLLVNAYAGATLVSSQSITQGNIGDWTSVSVGGSGITSLVLTGSASGFSPYAIDNLNVTAVPEPASMALMAAGLGLIGVARRRRS